MAYEGDLFCYTNWWHFLLVEGWAGPLCLWSGDSCLICTIWAYTQCELCSKMAGSLTPKEAFLSGMQSIPLHGALPGLERFKVTFSSRLTDMGTVLLKMKRPSILLFVYWSIHSFIFWNYKINFMTWFWTSTHEVPEHCGYYLHSRSRHIFNNYGTIT